MLKTEKQPCCSSQTIHSQKEALLGDYQFRQTPFSGLERELALFAADAFKELNEWQRMARISETLLKLLAEAPKDSFLLFACLDYIKRVDDEKLLENGYSLRLFEFWLNQFSGLSSEDNLAVRAKIVGKRIPRDSYQSLFPIGMGKTYAGSHFISAHMSPDLDTAVASFWGWLDAFGSRVGEGLHLWNVPGGAPPEQITSVFQEFFGEAFFSHAAVSHPCLKLSARDLVKQKGFVKKHGDTPTSNIDHGRTQNTVVLVDDHGAYLGDWRCSDVEGVKQVAALLDHCLHWFENHLYVKLVSLFAKKDLTAADARQFISHLMDQKVADCKPAKGYSAGQRQQLQDCLIHVLKIPQGLECSFNEFGEAVEKLSGADFSTFRRDLEALPVSELFDAAGRLIENRSAIFHRLERLVQGMVEAVQTIREYADRLDVSMNIKHLVLKYPAEYVMLSDDVEEIRSKLGAHSSLTVVQADKAGALFPVGRITATDLHKPILGTVSLRDFCNKDEMPLAPYLEVISVIDHHKSGLQSSNVPVVITGDVQSSNVLLAEQAFLINDAFGSGGSALESLRRQSKQLEGAESPESLRLQYRLVKRQLACQQQGEYFIHPSREFLEYMTFLHAILDDTDLLSKVTVRDVICISQLINRLKSLTLGREVEVISLDDLPRDANFAKAAAKRLLQHEDLYSLYKKIYAVKEQVVDQQIQCCARGEASNFFADTKDQNGCCCAGQTKLFPRNFEQYAKEAHALRCAWLKRSEARLQQNANIVFYLHMASTVCGADEVYRGEELNWTHQDEMWLWVPPSPLGHERLVSFLKSFKQAPEAVNNRFELEFPGPNAQVLSELFSTHFLEAPQKVAPQAERHLGLPIAILRFLPGSINSRKSMITPYLPKL
jgi:hypothetical protein